MNKLRITLVWLLTALAAQVFAAGDFFTTTGFSFTRRHGGTSFSARVDFPVSGSSKAVESVKQWMGDVLEVNMPISVSEEGFERALQQSFDSLLVDAPGVSRHVEITRAYEDEEIVTYLSTVVDRDTATWRDEDCASFSKTDGHRITAKEVFKCSERQIKQLMWQYRGDLPVGVASPDELVVGDVGFIDGWVIVIGPARGYTGAAYRIRYQEAEPCLRGNRNEGYYEEGED